MRHFQRVRRRNHKRERVERRESKMEIAGASHCVSRYVSLRIIDPLRGNSDNSSEQPFEHVNPSLRIPNSHLQSRFSMLQPSRKIQRRRTEVREHARRVSRRRVESGTVALGRPGAALASGTFISSLRCTNRAVCNLILLLCLEW